MLNEKKLVEKLGRILKKEFGTNLAFREFSAGYGIADLVFAPNFSFTKRAVRRTPLTDFMSLQLLIGLEEGRSYKFSEILEVFPFLDKRELKKHLRPLLINEYVTLLDSSTYIKNSRVDFNFIKRVVAVEVKLSDHRGGLVQARRYQYFADESYLAILKEAEKNINFVEFNKHNIGLILFDQKSDSIEIRHPSSTNKNYENMVSLFAKEMMLNRYLSVS